MKRIELLVVEDCATYLIPVVSGLASNRDLIISEMERIKPDLTALAVSPEELDGLLHLEEADLADYELGDYERIYVEKLRAYGKVGFPPPEYTAAVDYSRKKKVPIAALDMNDRLFTELYVSHVSTTELIRHSMRKKRVWRKKFRDEEPEQFAISWDRYVNNMNGFRTLNIKREEYMARRLRKLAAKHRNIAAVVPVERAEGIAGRLKNLDLFSRPEDEHDHQQNQEKQSQ